MLLKLTYMQQLSPPSRDSLHPPKPGVHVSRMRLGLKEYLSLYESIGRPYQWDERLRLPTQRLAEILESECLDHFVLELEHQPIGLCEFDRTALPEIELVNFGLIPSMHGQGLGSYFLDHCLREAWKHGPVRIWLHTDTNDHPSAIRVYSNAGFEAYLERVEEFPD